MPKVIFWNIQRAGQVPFTADNIVDDLAGLASGDPDVIMLCEGLADLAAGIGNRLPHGYGMVAPSTLLADYKSPTTLRYVVIAKTALGANATLIPGSSSRPSVLTTWGTNSFVSLHAPSVTASQTPQATHINTSYDAAVKQPGLNGGPDLFIGDMNVNANKSAAIGNFKSKLKGAVNGGYAVASARRSTHDRGGNLDWALHKTALNVSVAVVEAQEDDTARPGKRRKLGWDEEEFMPVFQDTKSSDHRPIVVEW